jgi:Leucine-rich repeat (LRR) protein
MLLELDNLEILRLGKNRITEIPAKLYDSKIKLVILSENPIPVGKIKNRIFFGKWKTNNHTRDIGRL